MPGSVLRRQAGGLYLGAAGYGGRSRGPWTGSIRAAAGRSLSVRHVRGLSLSRPAAGGDSAAIHAERVDPARTHAFLQPDAGIQPFLAALQGAAGRARTGVAHSIAPAHRIPAGLRSAALAPAALCALGMAAAHSGRQGTSVTEQLRIEDDVE